jgi:hypothetical protein
MEAVNYQHEVSELIDDQDDTYIIQQDQSWRINDLETAVWADEKIHEKEIKIFEIENVADSNIKALEEKIEKLKIWKEESTKNSKSEITFFKEHLHLWHEKKIGKEKAENEDLKLKGKKEKKLSLTIKLPYRNLTCRTQQPVITVNGKEIAKAKDDEVFVKYVKESNPSMIKTIEEVKWAEFKDTLKTSTVDGKLTYVDEDGSPIDFINLQVRGDKYDWKVNKETEY